MGLNTGYLTLILFLGVMACIPDIVHSQPVKISREVSGIVRDSLDDAIAGALVVLKTRQDSLRTVSNDQGVFIFRGVTSGQFTVSVRSIGYTAFVKRYLYNDDTRQIILDPVILRNSYISLAAVKINGSASVIYKQDTTEYRAFDYQVKPGAYIEDLIKKMEGVTVSRNGMVTHLGHPVVKAKINGAEYAGGSVVNAVKTLPAEIVEKIQMIDDYGEEAERTGIKSGDPNRIMNIVTRRDKSVGNRLEMAGAGGTKERYDAKLNISRINLNQQIAALTGLNRTLAGITAGTDGFLGEQAGEQQAAPPGGGVTDSFNGSLGYSDDLNKKMSVSGNYSVNRSDADQESNSITDEYNETFGRVLIKELSNSDNKTILHTLTGQLKYRIDSSNYLSVSPALSFEKTDVFNSQSLTQSGGVKQDAHIQNLNNSKTPVLSISSLYSHNFRKPGRVFSLNFTARNAEEKRHRNTGNTYRFYDPGTGSFLADSAANLLVNFVNSNRTIQLSSAYSEPVSPTSKIEFNARFNLSGYKNDQLVDEVIDNTPVRSDSLSKIYHYSFIEQRYSLGYHYLKGNYNISLGMMALPSVLKGRSGALDRSTRRTAFNLVPLFHFYYNWRALKTVSLDYYGTSKAPGFEQVQDVPDVSDPLNIIVGNPRLKQEFRHVVEFAFNYYLPNSKWNFLLNGQLSMTSNKIVRNIQEIDRSRGSRITYFENREGERFISANYEVSKQFNSLNYKIRLSGNGSAGRSPSLINGSLNESRTLRTIQNVELELYPVRWLEIIPGARYGYLNTDFSMGTGDQEIETYGFTASGMVDFFEGTTLTFNGSKNYISGTQVDVNKEPFIIYLSLSKDFLNRRATFRINVSDLLNQNNFISRRVYANSITDYTSKVSSRYLMFGLTFRLQKWTAAPLKDGKEIPRSGDGRFLK